MFDLKRDQNIIHITGTTAAQSPCTALTARGDRMTPMGSYVNIHDAITNAQAITSTSKRTICRHCLSAAKRL